MPRIHTIVTDTTVQDVDILVGSDGDSTKGNVTRSYTVGSLKTHMINSGVDASFGNLTLSGNATMSGNATISGNLSVTGNAVIDGNLTFGNADTDTVAFGADIVSNIVPDVNNTYSLGTSSKKWKFIHLSGLQTSGIDFADNVYLRFGADQDFAIWHDGQDTNLSNTTGIMKFSGLSQFANNVLLPTDIHLYFGGTHSDADLRIFHDGTHSYIQESGDGDLRIETTGSVVVKAPVGAASDLELWADNGSNHSDVWKLTAQTDNVFEIQTKDGGSFAPVMELSASDKKVWFKGDIYVPGNLELNNITVKAGQDEAAQIELKADAGDNNSDHWKLSAEADNVFEIQTRDGGTYAPVMELSASDKKVYFKGDIYAPSNLEIDNITVKAGEEQPAQIEFKADKGDNNSDHWRLSAETDNIFEIQTRDGGTYAPSVMFVASDKSTIFKGDIYVTGIIENQHFKIPNAIGSAGQVLKVPSSGNTLEWGAVSTGITHIDQGTGFTGSIMVGHSTTGTLDNARSNTSVGVNAMRSITSGDDNIIIGNNAAGALTAGDKNVFIGRDVANTVTNQNENVAIGYRALYTQDCSNGSQSYTVAVGMHAGYLLTNDQPYATIVGAYAGDGITTGQYNTCIGAFADTNSGADQNCTVIGYGASGHGSNIVVIGSGSVTAWHPGDDNGVDLGSPSYSFKDSYVQGRSNAGNFKVDALNTAPSSASDTGTVGEIRYTADYIYICVDTNTWKRAAISTWS